MTGSSHRDPFDFSSSLDDGEIDELDRFLMSDAAGDETLTLSALDGYLTAIVIGPVTVMPSRWLPGVWGSPEADGPRFASEEQAQRIMSLMLRHMNGIVAEFEADAAAYEPMFEVIELDGREYLCGEGWSMGFMHGVELVRNDWQPLFDCEPLVEAMRPLHLLGSEHITAREDRLVRTPLQREKLTRRIPQALFAIHAFWLPYREANARRESPGPVVRDEPKIGRNDPCPCGSGAKYKKCCGSPATRH